MQPRLSASCSRCTSRLLLQVRDAKVKLSDSPEGTVVEVRKGKESAAEGATKQTFVLSYTMADSFTLARVRKLRRLLISLA